MFVIGLSLCLHSVAFADDTFVLQNDDGTVNDYTVTTPMPGESNTTIYQYVVKLDGTSIGRPDFDFDTITPNVSSSITIHGKILSSYLGTTGTHTIEIGATGMLKLESDYITLATYTVTFVTKDEKDSSSGNNQESTGTVDNSSTDTTDTTDTSQESTGTVSSSGTSGTSSTSTSNTASGSSSTSSNASGSSSTDSTSLMLDPSIIVYIGGISAIQWVANVYFIYWLLLIAGSVWYYVSYSDFMVRKLTFGKREIETDEDFKKLNNDLIIGLLVIAAYFSGAYLYISYILINFMLTVWDTFSTYLNSL